MKEHKFFSNYIQHVRDLVIVVVIGNVVAFLFYPDVDNFFRIVGLNSLYSLFIGGTLWKGNQFIGMYCGRKMNYNKEPYKVLRTNLVIMVVYSLIAILVVNYIWFVLIFGWTIEQLFSQSSATMIVEFGITIIITAIYFSVGFFNSWRDAAVNEERLQKESIKLQYKALKNQVNPHFLFNSLNSLTSLVYHEPDLAAKFIKQLSEVYRYVLEHKDTELVALTDEINFCERYVFLQKIRHDKNLNVKFDLESKEPGWVVPVSIQMLIENAIKHNEISDENPLSIEISKDEDYITLKNNLQPRSVMKESGGIGLSTIRARYNYLSKNPVKIVEHEGVFQIQIPLINKVDHESINN
ncbi:MAG: histidine kinase [Bacteroidales bacterium]|nr:histidine kinase [Bacteroidales bacterium]MCF8405120.1 histidine kinase [Bacteroidales bacterium]